MRRIKKEINSIFLFFCYVCFITFCFFHLFLLFDIILLSEKEINHVRFFFVTVTDSLFVREGGEKTSKMDGGNLSKLNTKYFFYKKKNNYVGEK